MREAALGAESIRGILKLNTNFTTLLERADELAVLKKTRGNAGDTDQTCGRKYNLYTNILRLFALPTKSATSGKTVRAVRA
jgi:hypothetical protein